MADVRWSERGGGRPAEQARTCNKWPPCVSNAPPASRESRTSAAIRTPTRSRAGTLLPLLLLLFQLQLSAAATSDNANTTSSNSDVTHEAIDADLAARNMTACAEHLCNIHQKRPRLSEDWNDRGCMCDRACGAFADCCRDVESPDRPRADVVCRRLRHYDGVYMVSACPAAWLRTGDATVARLCARPAPLAQDPFGGMPVSSPSSRLTYRNYYCAMCHADALGAVFWRPRVECPTLLPRRNVTDRPTVTADSLRQDEAGQWGVLVAEGARETFHVCQIDPFFTETVEYFVRRCRVTVAACAANWTQGDATARLCAAYSAYVYDYKDVVYRNAHCALCNHVPAEEQFCVRRPMLRTGFRANTFNTRSFAILMDIGDRSGSERVGAVTVCSSTQLWDPFFKRCRDVVCDAAGYRLVDGACVASPAVGGDGDVDSSGNFSRPVSNDTTPATPFLLCPKFHLNESEYELGDNDTVYVPVYDRRYAPGQYQLEDGRLAVCALTQNLSKFDQALSYISLVCLAASVICLLMHLLAFCTVHEIRNLSGKNLASLSFCLLVGYVCFLIGPTQQPGEDGCTALAVVMYGAFIASFFWMHVMAFDVFTTLRKATRELRVATGRHLGRYLCYAGYVVAMSSALVVAAVLANNSDAVPAAYRPGFGDRSCWFGRRKALMAFFAAPLAAVMGMNVVMFVASAKMIRETTKSTAHMTCGPSQVNLRLYSRLAIIMGLSWVVGLVAGWMDFPPLWYAFVVLNTLQGVFIFVSFTLADKVRERVRRRAASWMSPSEVDSNIHTDSSGLSVHKARR